jgi:hypothetical protein
VGGDEDDEGGGKVWDKYKQCDAMI